ncbi:MAG: FAA hydrolase family protein [Ilumatobacter sp.]|nr:MAG: FAA hydrolase family protein [Ilumatobacter sp.]
MTFRLANLEGRAALVAADPDGVDRWYDLERVSDGRLPADPMAAIRQADELHVVTRGLDTASPDGRFDQALAAGSVGPPVPRPTNCFAVGLNYRTHAEEAGLDVPDTPLVFTKFPGCLAGPRDEVQLCADRVDYEVELVVVIGSGGRSIPAGRAWEHLIGLTVGQDVSDRTLQFAATPPHFDLGKSRDTYGPIGPVLVSTDSFRDPDDLALTCDINGERRQDDRTSNLVFGVPALVEYLSGILTLLPGDLIFTGTPAGVGVGRGVGRGQPLVAGDEIVSAVEGIGTLVNRCVSGPT